MARLGEDEALRFAGSQTMRHEADILTSGIEAGLSMVLSGLEGAVPCCSSGLVMQALLKE